MTTTKNGGYNSSTGIFGKWDPLTYRFLSQQGDERVDLSTAEWLRSTASRVVGGGPATNSRDGKPLTSLTPDANNIETSMLDETGNARGLELDRIRHDGDELLPLPPREPR